MRHMGKAQDSRATYIAAATSAFAQTGYHGTSLAMVAREAGVTKQALLHFFGTKEQLYAAVLSDLALRQCEGIDDAARSSASAHLMTYFMAFHEAAVTQPSDIQLVVRALLDSRPDARVWPLKPYLDRLIALAKAARHDLPTTDAAALAWLSQMLGTVHYLTISTPALDGMYGADTRTAVVAESRRLLAKSVVRFVEAPALVP